MNASADRVATIERRTKETDITLELNIDGSGRAEVQTGVGFLDHMLTLFTVHGFFDLSVKATGDVDVDYHHTVEDIGICLGKAFDDALGDKGGIARYGASFLPMDEALVRVVVDISNRPYLHYEADVADQKVGTFDTCLAKEFMRAFCHNCGLTLHIDKLHGENAHHIIEAVFKATARAVNQAVQKTAMDGALSSKGCL